MKKILLVLLVTVLVFTSVGVIKSYKSITNIDDVEKVMVLSENTKTVKTQALGDLITTIIRGFFRTIIKIFIGDPGGGSCLYGTNSNGTCKCSSSCSNNCNSDGSCPSNGGLTDDVKNRLPSYSLAAFSGSCTSLIGTEKNNLRNRIQCIAKSQVSKVRQDCGEFTRNVLYAAGGSSWGSTKSSCTPGDRIVFSGHYGIYIDDSSVIHANYYRSRLTQAERDAGVKGWTVDTSKYTITSNGNAFQGCQSPS